MHHIEFLELKGRLLQHAAEWENMTRKQFCAYIRKNIANIGAEDLTEEQTEDLYEFYRTHRRN